MSQILVVGGRLIDPASGVDDLRDLLIRDGAIEAIAAPGRLPAAPAAPIIAARGRWVVPGLIDPHVHLRDPGFPQKESIRSGLAAAAAGGFTAVAAMANTEPVNDCPAVTRYMLAEAAIGGTRLIPVGAVTCGLAGREMVDFAALVEAGVRMFSDDGMPIDDPAILHAALYTVGGLGLAISLHEEDRSLVAEGAINAGAIARRLGVAGIPSAAESARLKRDLAIAIGAGQPIHIAHLSTGDSLALLKAARAQGAQVTCEVTPHHFTLEDSAVLEFGPDAKMNPPLRMREDVEALHAAMADGTIDMIATDHAPHDPDSKHMAVLAGCFAPGHVPRALDGEQAQALTTAANGVVGLETALGLALGLVHRGVIEPSRLVEMMALNPARLLRLEEGGRLYEGGPADLTVIDPELSWQVRPQAFLSRSRNTPFANLTLKGRAVLTMVAGRVAYDLKNYLNGTEN